MQSEALIRIGGRGCYNMAATQDHLLVAHMDNARILSTILKSVQFQEVISPSMTVTIFSHTPTDGNMFH